MFQLKSRIISLWHSLDLIADDPGIEQDWSARHQGAGLKVVGRTTLPRQHKSAVPPKAPSARTGS